MATKTNSLPLVSVLMPVYNYEGYVDEAIRSILDQTYKNIEFIIVDDYSTDDSWKVIQEWAKKDKRIKAFRNAENLKIVGTLNFAVSKSTGKYLARMDGDDSRELDSIEAQVEYLEKNPDVVMVGGAVTFADSNMIALNNRRYPTTDEAIRAKLFRYSPFCHASLVLRAATMEPYIFNWAEDYDLYFRLAKKGKMANLDKIVYNVRTHKASVSRSKTRYQEKLTLYIRLRAVFEYGYTMSSSDKLYFVMQLLTMYIMPPNFRFWLFNKLRSN